MTISSSAMKTGFSGFFFVFIVFSFFLDLVFRSVGIVFVWVYYNTKRGGGGERGVFCVGRFGVGEKRGVKSRYAKWGSCVYCGEG